MGEGGWRLGKLGNLRTTFHNPYLAVPFVQYGAPTRSTTSYLICAFWNDSAIALGTYQFAQDMLAAVWVAFACGQNAGLLENASPGGEAPLLGCGAETVVLGPKHGTCWSGIVPTRGRFVRLSHQHWTTCFTSTLHISLSSRHTLPIL